MLEVRELPDGRAQFEHFLDVDALWRVVLALPSNVVRQLEHQVKREEHQLLPYRAVVHKTHSKQLLVKVLLVVRWDLEVKAARVAVVAKHVVPTRNDGALSIKSLS